MRTPVCESDLKEGELCPSCRAKLAAGRITWLDFEVAQVLYKINDRYNISNASFCRALDLGAVVLVFTQGEAGLLIGKQGKVVGELSSALGKKVRIAEASGDVKKTISDIIMPARLLGINRVFQGGKEMTKVRIARADAVRLPIDIASLRKVLCTLIGGEAELSFE